MASTTTNPVNHVLTWMEEFAAEIEVSELRRFQLRASCYDYLTDRLEHDPDLDFQITKHGDSDTIDISINDDVGIWILTSIDKYSVRQHRSTIRELHENYDHLIIYGEPLSDDHTSAWYNLQRKTNPQSGKETYFLRNTAGSNDNPTTEQVTGDALDRIAPLALLAFTAGLLFVGVDFFGTATVLFFLDRLLTVIGVLTVVAFVVASLQN